MNDNFGDKQFNEITLKSSQKDLEDLIKMIPTDPDYDVYYSL